jgi:hypothetical protein
MIKTITKEADEEFPRARDGKERATLQGRPCIQLSGVLQTLSWFLWRLHADRVH